MKIPNLASRHQVGVVRHGGGLRRSGRPVRAADLYFWGVRPRAGAVTGSYRGCWCAAGGFIPEIPVAVHGAIGPRTATGMLLEP